MGEMGSLEQGHLPGILLNIRIKMPRTNEIYVSMKENSE
jgi:hypothetical protein